MLLNELKGNKSHSKKKCLGRGIGSGKGKTCGRGAKGQKSRSGVSLSGFEGGQTPLYRRVPKRGFNSHKKQKYEIFTLYRISNLIKAGKLNPDSITILDLQNAGALKKSKVKIIGKWNNLHNITIETHYASENVIKYAKEFTSSIKIVK